MKLRNKKTGEIVEVGDWSVGIDSRGCRKFYHSIAEFNAEWEDYEPAEPLIKDENIRKVVRAWANGNMATRVQYDAFWRGFRNRDSSITVWEKLPLEDNGIYTIAELCGEEEE